MNLRQRVASAVVLVAVPVAGLLMYGTWHVRRNAFLDTAYASTLARMESGGREQCESNPRGFRLEQGPRSRRLERFRGDNEEHHPEAQSPFGRVHRSQRARVFAYSAALQSADANAPELSGRVREELLAGETRFEVHSPRVGPQVVLKMPWNEGPCAVLLLDAPSLAAAHPARPLARDLFVAVLILGAAIGAAWFALGSTLRRISKLAESVRGISIADYQAPPDARATAGDEVDALSTALRDASLRVRAQLDELRARETSLRGYVDGTTHDLAIPITVLKGRLGTLNDALNNAEAIPRNVLSSAVSECEYLAQLVANLAAAARLDTQTEPHVPVDLNILVERVASRLVTVATPLDVSIAFSVPDEHLYAMGDELLLERALSNLINNAIVHPDRAGPGHIAVILSVEGAHQFALSIRNDGTPPSIDELKALQAGTETPKRKSRGNGLGLRIARTVASQHTFELQFARGPEGGLVVTLSGRRIDRSHDTHA